MDKEVKGIKKEKEKKREVQAGPACISSEGKKKKGRTTKNIKQCPL